MSPVCARFLLAFFKFALVILRESVRFFRFLMLDDMFLLWFLRLYLYITYRMIYALRAIGGCVVGCLHKKVKVYFHFGIPVLFGACVKFICRC